jgi:hypothetical protein
VKPDVIYIDANHHYEGAKEDISTCLKFFKGAHIAGDDYGNYEDVKRAVHECATDYGQIVYVDATHCWTYTEVKGHAITKTVPSTNFDDLLSGFSKGGAPVGGGGRGARGGERREWGRGGGGERGGGGGGQGWR